MQLTPYLIFNGNCRDAFAFYARCLDGEVKDMLTYAEAPDSESMPAESRDMIMHARLVARDQELMASDHTPECPLSYEGIKGAFVSLHFEDTEEAERIFNALADNGTVQMPFEETFWAKRFGMLVDKFGVSWMVNCCKGAM